MQLNPRIVANLLVILVNLLVNLLAKPTKSRLGGPWGGLTPLTSLSQACIPPPKEGCLVLYDPSPTDPFGCLPKGANPGGQPFGGVSGVIPPQDGPPNLGIARDLLGSIPGRFVTDFLPIYMDFLGRLFLVTSRVSFTIDYLFYIHVFFSDDVLRRN